MAKQKKESCCEPSIGSCRVEAIVNVDERGQVVLPKEVREKIGIKAGDKLALASWECCGTISCLFILKAEDLDGMVKVALSPVAKEIIK